MNFNGNNLHILELEVWNKKIIKKWLIGGAVQAVGSGERGNSKCGSENSHGAE